MRAFLSPDTWQTPVFFLRETVNNTERNEDLRGVRSEFPGRLVLKSLPRGLCTLEKRNYKSTRMTAIFLRQQGKRFQRPDTKPCSFVLRDAFNIDGLLSTHLERTPWWFFFISERMDQSEILTPFNASRWVTSGRFHPSSAHPPARRNPAVPTRTPKSSKVLGSFSSLWMLSCVEIVTPARPSRAQPIPRRVKTCRNNNAYEVNSLSPLALQHGDSSVLERHHVFVTYRVPFFFPFFFFSDSWCDDTHVRTRVFREARLDNVPEYVHPCCSS